MNRYTILALVLLASPAFATCPPGDNRPYPECLKPPVVTPPTTPPSNHNEQGQEQDQQQGQAQGQAQGQGQIATGGNGTGVGIGQGGNGGTGGNANSTAVGGAGGRGGSSDQSQNAFSGVSGSGNSTNSLGASAINGDSRSDSNSHSGSASQSGSYSEGSDNAVQVDNRNLSSTRVDARTNYLGSVVPMSQPVINGVGNLIVRDSMICGPLQTIERVPLEGISRGGRGRFRQGDNDRLVMSPYINENGIIQTSIEINGIRYGHRAVSYVAVVNTGTSRGFSIGGFGNNGGGQLGASGATGVQQIQKLIDLELCELDQPRPVIQFKEPRVPRG